MDALIYSLDQHHEMMQQVVIINGNGHIGQASQELTATFYALEILLDVPADRDVLALYARRFYSQYNMLNNIPRPLELAQEIIYAKIGSA